MRDPRSSGPGRTLRALAAVVLCLQLFPAGVPVAAGLAHGLYHFSDRLSLDYLLHLHSHGHGGVGHRHAAEPAPDREGAAHRHTGPSDHRLASVDGPHHAERAVASTVTADAAADAGASDDAAPPLHDHIRAVDALLEVAGDDGISDIGSPPSPDRGLDLHLPSGPAQLASTVFRSGAAAADHALRLLVANPSLDPPPPRA